MGFKSTIQGLVQKAITQSLGDLTSTMTLKTVVAGTYNPATGSVPQTVTSHTAKCVLTNIRQDETVDAEMVRNGKKALVPTLELKGVVIDSLDDLVVVDDVEYQLCSIKLDPAGALYTMQLIARQEVKFDGVY